MKRFPAGVGAVAGIVLVAAGVWALTDPRGFFDTTATFSPYNQHFVHDIGAFAVGLGSALLLGLRVTKALAVALVGNAVAAVLHAISHVVDRDLGGRSSDPLLFTVIAVVLVLAAARSLKDEPS